MPRKAATPDVEDAVSLLDDLKNDVPDASDEEPGDLLDKLLSGANAKAWRPDEEGQGVQGVVVDVDSMVSEYKDNDSGEYPECPVITVEDKDGECWRIIGFASVLRKELQKKDPQIGDTLAVLYVGEGEAKKGRKAPHLYRVAVRHA